MTAVESIYGRYIALTAAHAQHPDGAQGRFLFALGLSASTCELILAASIAGAASLTIESHAMLVRNANLHRVIDFTVSTLSESIRILKNQLRKRQAAAICLTANAEAALAEMEERGLQPDIVSWDENGAPPDWATPFLRRGASAANAADRPSADRGSGGLLDVTWTVAESAGLWLPKIDRVLESLLASDPRARWIHAAPLYLGKPLYSSRFVRLTREEADRFGSEVALLRRSGEIGACVTVTIASAGRVAPVTI